MDGAREENITTNDIQSLWKLEIRVPRGSEFSQFPYTCIYIYISLYIIYINKYIYIKSIYI